MITSAIGCSAKGEILSSLKAANGEPSSGAPPRHRGPALDLLCKSHAFAGEQYSHWALAIRRSRGVTDWEAISTRRTF